MPQRRLGLGEIAGGRVRCAQMVEVRGVGGVDSHGLGDGIGRFGEILREMSLWLEEREYLSLNELHGSLSQLNVAAPAAFERANYIQIVRSYNPTFR